MPWEGRTLIHYARDKVGLTLCQVRAERGGEAGFSEKKEQGWGGEGVGKVSTLTAVLRQEASWRT